MHKHHIIPKFEGGSNDPSNLIEVSVEEHAEIHRKRFEEFGHWQDYVAWQGLSGRIGKEDIIQLKNRLAHLGKPTWNKGVTGKNSHFYGVKQNSEWIEKRTKYFRKSYIIVDPNGESTVITGLNEFCRQNKLQAQNMVKVAQGKRKDHKGYTCSYVKEMI